MPLQAAFATAAVVGLQVLLPRVFSVLLWYHLGFLAVSLAMLGFAAGGRWVRWRAARTGEPGGAIDRTLLGALAGMAAPAALVGILRLPLEASELLTDGEAQVALLGMVAAVAVPFLLLGTLVCSALDARRDAIGRVYGATFLGGAAGALLVLGAMEFGGTPWAVALVALLPLLPRPHWTSVLAAGAAATVLLLPADLLPFTSRKHFPAITRDQVLLERDTATSHVVFYENTGHHGLWADHPTWTGKLPRSIAAAIDAWAITFITERDGPEDFPSYLDAHPAGLAFQGVDEGFTALVIGAGGGWDVLQALKAGASHVTAVEINESIVDAATGRWAEYSGNLYDDPRVELHVSEGRHFLEHETRTYDRIVLAGVDTFAATQAGAFALSENYLYTVEAFRSYLERLEPGGRLFMTRWWFDPPRQTLRLALTAAEALREIGVDDPRRRLFIARGSNALFFMKAGSDYTEPELNGLASAVAERGLSQVYAWSSPWERVPRPSHPTLVEALDAQDPEAWAEDYPYRVDPTTDDRPFFFENGKRETLFRAEQNWIHDRLGGQEVLVATLLALALLAWPLLFAGRGAPRGGNATLLPFLFLGIGYLFVEIPLMQRLSLVLGHPVYAVTVVLVSLLTWSGIGALLAGRLDDRSGPFVLVATAILVAVVLVGGHETLVLGLAHESFGWAVTTVVLYLALPGLVMGAGFPLAVRALGVAQPLLVPSAFTWNGFASVLAGPLAVLVALQVGFRVTLLFGAGCYVLAALMLLFARTLEVEAEGESALATAGGPSPSTTGDDAPRADDVAETADAPPTEDDEDWEDPFAYEDDEDAPSADEVDDENTTDEERRSAT